MIKRVFLVSILSAALAFPAQAQKLSLADLSSYLNGLKSVKGAFTQINDDGSLSTGTIMIKRPGRIRFEYDPPNQGLLLASGGEVAIFDPKSNLGPERYPLRRTPLSLILARNVNLARANMVTGHSYDGTATVVRAQDPEHPEYGNIELKFTGSPVELRQWVINSENGSQTTVILGEMDKTARLGDSQFNIIALIDDN